MVDRILTDISYQSADNLVDGLTKAEEEGLDGNAHVNSHSLDYSGYNYYQDYKNGGGYACPSDIFYGRPKRAVNTYGQWKVIVNIPDDFYTGKYTQTQRLEQCKYQGNPCSYIDPSIRSSCIQKHNFVRLLAYTYQDGLHIDNFKLPIACGCHLPKPKHYGQYPTFLPSKPYLDIPEYNIYDGK